MTRLTPEARRRLVLTVALVVALVGGGLAVARLSDPPDAIATTEVDGRTWLSVPRAGGTALVLANGISGLVEAEADVAETLPEGLAFAGSDARFTLLRAAATNVVVADGSHVAARVDTGAGSASVLADAGLVSAGADVVVRTVSTNGAIGAPTIVDGAGTPVAGVAPVVDGDGDAWVLTADDGDPQGVRIDDDGQVAERVDAGEDASGLVVVDGEVYARRRDRLQGLGGGRLSGAGESVVVPTVATDRQGRWAVAAGRQITIEGRGAPLTLVAPDEVRALAVWYGEVWIATASGAHRVRDDVLEPIPGVNGAFDVFADGGRLWLVSGDAAIAVDRRHQPTVFRLAGVDLSLCIGDCSAGAAAAYLDEVATTTTPPTTGAAPTTTVPAADITLPPVVPTTPPPTTVPPVPAPPPAAPAPSTPPVTALPAPTTTVVAEPSVPVTDPPATDPVVVSEEPVAEVPVEPVPDAEPAPVPVVEPPVTEPPEPVEPPPPARPDPPPTDPPPPATDPPPPPTPPPTPAPTPAPTAPPPTDPPVVGRGDVVLAFTDAADPIVGSTASVQIGFDGTAAACAATGGVVAGGSTTGTLYWSGAGSGSRQLTLGLGGTGSVGSEDIDVEPGELSVTFSVCGLQASIARAVGGESPELGAIEVSGEAEVGETLVASVDYAYGQGWTVGGASWTAGPCDATSGVLGTTGLESSSVELRPSTEGAYCIAVVVSFVFADTVVAEGSGDQIDVAPASTTTTAPAAATTTTTERTTTTTAATTTTTAGTTTTTSASTTTTSGTTTTRGTTTTTSGSTTTAGTTTTSSTVPARVP